MKNDRQLQHDVLEELDRESGIARGTIGAEVHHGTVKLSGSVTDETIKNLAELAVRRVDGVSTVIIDLRVQGGAAPARMVQGQRRIPQPA